MPSLVEQYIRAALPMPGSPFRDPLGRAEGEALDRLRFSEEELAGKRSTMGSRAWGSVWMQDPRAEGGSSFHRSFIESRQPSRILTPSDFEAATAGLQWVRFYDFAYTAQEVGRADPDFTVGTKAAMRYVKWENSYTLYIADMLRFQESWGQTRQKIRDEALLDGTECWVGGESNGPQKAAAADVLLDLAPLGYVVIGIDNLYQPETWMGYAEHGYIYVQSDEAAHPKRKWINAFLDEGEAWPNGTHDDTVKSASGAFQMAYQRAMSFPAGTSKGNVVLGGQKRW